MSQVKSWLFFHVRVLAVTVIGAAVLLGTACSGGEEVSPTPVDDATVGRQLFGDKGCATCHGQNAEGTDIAPALPGHNEEQVKRNVRSPEGSMPRFGPEQISDNELEMIAHYIESLAPVTEHIEPVTVEDALVTHHWMVLYALESGSGDEARASRPSYPGAGHGPGAPGSDGGGSGAYSGR